MRDLADVHYPNAALIRVVQDNLSTHTPGSLYETFPAAEAHRILERLENGEGGVRAAVLDAAWANLHFTLDPIATSLQTSADNAEAVGLLDLMPKKAAKIISKAVKSAAANAENNFKMSPEDLVVKTIFADEGPTMKRFRPRARGRANVIRKRSSHITVVVDDGEEY